MLMVFAAICPFALVGFLMPTGAMIASSVGGVGGAATGAATVASGAVDVMHRGHVSADAAPAPSPHDSTPGGSGSPSGATAAPEAGAVGSNAGTGAASGAAAGAAEGGAAAGAAEGGAAAGGAAAGAATGGAALVVQAVADGASKVHQGISEMVETSAEGIEG